MSCEWGHSDCTNTDKCWMCVVEDKYYKPSKKPSAGMSKRRAKPTGRRGSHFEYDNHVANKDLLTGATSRMTPNSGAGQIKGDEQIRGIISIMEELKTSAQQTSKGVKTISIQKEWLDKLRIEASQANKEFWYLKFAFGDYERDWYVILESDMVMSMVFTMVEDRKAKAQADARAEVAERRRQLTEAENVALLARIALLEAQLKEKELEGGGEVVKS
jgi:hypothetical protein